MIMADHGNLERMTTPKDKPDAAHASNPVPFVLIDPKGEDIELKEGKAFSAVAPAVLAQYVNTLAISLGPPTFAYQIGDIHLSREGIPSGDDLDGIFPFLEIQGIVATQPKTIQEPAGSTASGIQIPLKGYTSENLRNLPGMLYSKQRMIRKACCMPVLHLQEKEGYIVHGWLIRLGLTGPEHKTV